MTDRPDTRLGRSYDSDMPSTPIVPVRGETPFVPEDDDPSTQPARPRWALAITLFVATVFSVFWAGASYAAEVPVEDDFDLVRIFEDGWPFAVPLMSILLVHELGHYIAARLHGVDASLPYFLPLPKLGFGTMGAVIAMRGRIRSRNALLDIGAAGPLAGLVVAIPVIAIGLSLSPVGPTSEHYAQEGQSILYLLLKRVVVGHIPEGHDVFLHPTAFAGWAGLLVTMINLLPWGQLDGGHVAYALLGSKQNRVARIVRLLLLPLFGFNLARFLGPALLGQSDMPIEMAIGNSLFWLIWFVILGVIGRIAGGDAHPPFEPGELTRSRKSVAWVTLAIFVLLFMPTPMATY